MAGSNWTVQSSPIYHAREWCQWTIFLSLLPWSLAQDIAIADARGAVELAWQEGARQGKLEGRAALLREILQDRFGVLPDWVQAQLAAANLRTLQRWSGKIRGADGMEKIFE